MDDKSGQLHIFDIESAEKQGEILVADQPINSICRAQSDSFYFSTGERNYTVDCVGDSSDEENDCDSKENEFLLRNGRLLKVDLSNVLKNEQSNFSKNSF